MTQNGYAGYWQGGKEVSLLDGLSALDVPLYVCAKEGALVYGQGGSVGGTGIPIRAIAPALTFANLGDPTFLRDHGLKYPYYTGAMANGIASEAIVEEMGRAGMLGFFGAAGLSPARIEAACKRLTETMKGLPFGFNLINSPNDPLWQEAVADLYIKYGVRLVEASAYLSLSLPLVKYRVHGIHRDASGRVVAPNHVVAKVSRAEVARRFFAPPPEKMVRKLVESGHITEDQARMAQEIPVAQDVTVEADSGGHTDHRPMPAVLPAMIALRDEMAAQYNYACKLRVGAGGGIGTAAAAAAAFAMGAAYVVTGSVNQACVESGSSDKVRAMLAKASQTDVGQAPAADMFEMGVTVQVLKKGTRFVVRGAKLYELYRAYDSIDALPADERQKIEEQIFQAPLTEIWAQTRAFFEERDPAQVEKAEQNPRHKMALAFRWYLGQSSRWANVGQDGREDDYQIWCGPSMGAFNEWAAGTTLEETENRTVVAVAHNILFGAALHLRATGLRLQGVPVPVEVFGWKPVSGKSLAAAFE
ncbi:MAG: PfaD family polyunsaturated fatty acid/polyketide biosynthesis protein [Candidatus Hydrogenedentes bacterium]|nr:PfaD family polyunsaturated fatty acid/polyketide biosynthesis protein [Candidatus Hydrogenedentota bacterium]